ncbi:MAG: hypothetical protein LBR53_13335 [Deltaproteobacteria bacterium]|jgi:hypothetical protein|nr:hypothetical protein [Deltaproteobacteria bacterium]
MKIIPFAPVTERPGSVSAPSAPGRKDDFQRYLESSGGEMKAREKIGLENLIANESAPPGDLSQAASLLSGLIAQMGMKSPSELARIHNLEGILFYGRF